MSDILRGIAYVVVAGFALWFVIVLIFLAVEQVGFYRRYGVSKRQHDTDLARLRRMVRIAEENAVDEDY